MPSAILDMQSHDGKLVIAGGFDRIDRVPFANICAWNGTSFVPISTGIAGSFNPRISVLKCIDDRLIVGGKFTHAGDVETANIAEWSRK